MVLHAKPLHRYPDLEVESQCLTLGTTSLLKKIKSTFFDSQMFVFLKLIEVNKYANFFAI